jgi:Family of unknown function (DUF5677)
MSPETDFFADDPGRFQRFQREFRAQNLLGDLVNEILDRHGDKLKLKDGEERDLSLLISASFGKGLKTFQAISRLCALGFGEDAIILLRSNINLLINTRFILSDKNPVERTKEFIAYSTKERLKYLDLAHDGKRPTWAEKVDPEEIERDAERWKQTSIQKRAQQVAPFHYSQGYRLYSSIEHSDAMALNAYIGEWNETGPRIGSGPSDEYLGVALVHSFSVMADLLVTIMQYFDINRPDVLEKLKQIWTELGEETVGQGK